MATAARQHSPKALKLKRATAPLSPKAKVAQEQALHAMRAMGLTPVEHPPLSQAAARHFIKLFRGETMSPKKLQRLCRAKRIGAYRDGPGTHWKIPVASLLAFLRSQENDSDTDREGEAE